jgi:hypothetical protein
VTANLANFAYDPINYDFLKKAKAHELFLELLSNSDAKLVLHGIAGICNFVTDAVVRDYITKGGGSALILQLLDHSCIDVLVNALTTLIFLRVDNFTKETLERVQTLAQNEDKRLQNIARVFLDNASSKIFDNRKI